MSARKLVGAGNVFLRKYLVRKNTNPPIAQYAKIHLAKIQNAYNIASCTKLVLMINFSEIKKQAQC